MNSQGLRNRVRGRLEVRRNHDDSQSNPGFPMLQIRAWSETLHRSMGQYPRRFRRNCVPFSHSLESHMRDRQYKALDDLQVVAVTAKCLAQSEKLKRRRGGEAREGIAVSIQHHNPNDANAATYYKAVLNSTHSHDNFWRKIL